MSVYVVDNDISVSQLSQHVRRLSKCPLTSDEDGMPLAITPRPKRLLKKLTALALNGLESMCDRDERLLWRPQRALYDQ